MLLEETNASGVAQADYVYLNGRPVAVLNGSTLYYLHDDTLGTPQSATDSNQNIAWQATYQPFGQASVSGTVTQNLRLPGQYFDVESGWNHNGFRDYLPALGRYVEPDPLGMQGSARYYSPQTGRFISEGQIGFGGMINTYAYAGDDPTDFTDPSGKTCCTPEKRRFFDWLNGPLGKMASDLNTLKALLLTEAAKEGGWTTGSLDHNQPLNNPFGVNKINGKGQAAGNIQYPSS